MTIAAWQNAGESLVIRGHRNFVRDSGGRRDAIVILHGYPTSSYDYRMVWPMLTKKPLVRSAETLG